MSRPQPPKPAKLVIGIFLKETELLGAIAEALSEAFGPMDMASAWLPFNYTTYYESEMGDALLRRVFAFQKLIEQEALARIKNSTNDIEKAFMVAGKRRVNIDPGYMLHERFVLASGKNFSHRIYIGGRIYADLTLIYTKNRFQALPWTYPDYRDPIMLTYLEQVRQKYAVDVKKEKGIS
jgi:hypothetical protein